MRHWINGGQTWHRSNVVLAQCFTVCVPLRIYSKLKLAPLRNWLGVANFDLVKVCAPSEVAPSWCLVMVPLEKKHSFPKLRYSEELFTVLSHHLRTNFDFSQSLRSIGAQRKNMMYLEKSLSEDYAYTVKAFPWYLSSDFPFDLSWRCWPGSNFALLIHSPAYSVSVCYT